MIQVNPDTFQKELADKTGVILFKCYWPRGNEYEETGSGGYIDLWDKDNITGGGMFLRSMYGFFGVLSDLSHSKQIWFWEVK
ncbi:T6SS effector amidase Tae4 family protein [Azovibrio restrictus]|uniref:T6SS effector amidase Tae4 family protein n=1 Tax=Azovibrio restrictus TaxID=146938 RepID=UPI0026F09D98|nr:T6SS effector amidase Tae4 family protein [Azovibrio restrictus]MDD3481778.1 T6SS effector amidase Tae4 family protein [Azovibrio restrictus]